MKQLSTIILIVCTLFISCDTGSQKDTLGSKSWEVIQLENDLELSKAPNLTIDISDKKVNGNAGCNNFFGTMELNENNISFHSLGSTRMLCPHMSIEDKFLSLIEDVRHYTFEDGNLVLLSAEDRRLIILR